MRLLMIGDIVGKPGRKLVTQALPGLIAEHELDCVIANAENAAGGSGLTKAQYRELIDAGVDCITMGDHIYKRKELYEILDNEENIVKPANFPPEAPGREFAVVPARNGVSVGVISLLGRVFMRPVDCPWKAADRVLHAMPPSVRVIGVDFHAEATSDMQLMGRHLDGRVTFVLGTHTHVPTADEAIFPRGTAFQCDVGMTGPYESILGRRIDRVLHTTVTFRPNQFEVASEDSRLAGTVVECNPDSGKATGIYRIMVREEELNRLRRSAADSRG